MADKDIPLSDEEAIEKFKKAEYQRWVDEIKRRKAKVGDEYRDDRDLSKFRDRHRGEYNYSDISMFDLWVKEYYDKFGGIMYRIDTGWTCPHCHTWYGLAYPPETCRVCGHISPLGELYRKGHMFRR